MTEIVFLRHFETKVDPDKPVAEWELSEDGEQRMDELLRSNRLNSIEKVLSSPEKKALRTAKAIAEKHDVPLEEVGELREVDRSGEGFIENHEEYVRMVGEYLANPRIPFKWENREAVEERIRSFLDKAEAEDATVLVVGHGMFFSTLLPEVKGEEPFTFWKELGFGEIIETDIDRIRQVFRIG